MADLNTLVDQLSALTILEAAELKTLLEDKWGVKAAAGGMMMAAPAAGAAAPAAEVEEKTEFDVVLVDPGANKINVIKVVRALTNLGLKEAKDVTETANSKVLEAVTKERAADARKQLEEAGAKVEVK
jgi:large subunit ribosomal protein L7/L12